DQLRAGAKQWDARGRKRGLLWRGDVLTEYRLWRARYLGRLTELEEAFGAACLRDGARGRVIRRMLVGGAFALGSAAAGVVYGFGMRAQASATEATHRTIDVLAEQGRREILDQHPLAAATPLARAYTLGGRDAALRLLLKQAVSVVESQGAVMRGHEGFVRRA